MNKFKVGDVVRVKDFYEIAKTFVGDNKTSTGLYFNEAMLSSCGNLYTITNVSCYHKDRYLLNDWFYDERWLELVMFECTLEDVYHYDEDIAYQLADKIRDDYNIIALDLNSCIDDDEFKENATYRTRHARDIKFSLRKDATSIDLYNIVLEGYGLVDYCRQSTVDGILLCKKMA